MDNRETGRLKTYDVIKGYGFIQREQGQDVFVNFAEFEKATDAAAIVGALLEFTVSNEGKGPRARHVKIIG